MAKKQESEPTEKNTKQETVAEKPVQTKAVAQKAPWPLITIGIFVTVIIVALIAICATALVNGRQTTSGNSRGTDHMSMNNSDFGSRRESTDRPERSGGRGSFMTPAASGVITAIDGDTITVAGGGKRVTVKKTANTVISGDEGNIAVNDTVIVTGTTSDDGTVTATRIVVRNAQSFGPASRTDTAQTPGA